jgi:GT2 family glycosyltransferase
MEGRDTANMTTNFPIHETESAGEARQGRSSNATASGMARLVAIVPTYQRRTELLATLRTVLQQTRTPDEIVVVDNDGDPGLADVIAHVLEAASVSVKVVTSPTNLGSAGGWACGLRTVIDYCEEDDWILILDDDDPPRADDEIEGMWRFARQQQTLDEKVAGVGIVGARFNWVWGVIDRLADNEITDAVDVDYIGNGHVALYSARVIKQAGFFDDALFFGNTEVEYGIRLRREGYRLVANGKLWKRRRIRENRTGLRVRPRMTVDPTWRKYYVVRNHIYLLRRSGRLDLAILHGLFQSLVKPALTFCVSPRRACTGLRLGLRASLDGLLGRMGRRVEPTTWEPLDK